MLYLMNFIIKIKFTFLLSGFGVLEKNHNGIIVNDIGFSYLAGFLKEAFTQRIY